MSALDALRTRIARLISPRAPARTGQRAYHAAQGGRLTAGWQSSNSSADAELVGGLQKLRGRSRALIRDAAYAKRAKTIVVNNVIGGGIGLQAQVKFPRGALDQRVNDGIESAWEEWTRAAHCHTGGKLHFADLERLVMGQVFEAGELLIRKHYLRLPGSAVPLALEVIEPERLADQYSIGRQQNGNEVRMGVEIDSFQRPVAYWLHAVHPGDVAIGAGDRDRLIRVPAAEMIHLYIVDRWPQVRGEPWLHAVARRLNDMDGYSEAEIVAARGAAAYMAFIKTPDSSPIPVDDQIGDQRVVDMSPGIVEQLPPGWDVVMNNPNRPNPAMDPFMRMMLREVAAGVGVSYESLSRDYSQSNYSSSRLSLLDDRDLWRVLQGWIIRSFRQELHRDWMNQAVLAGAIPEIRVDDYATNRQRFDAAFFKPRGWSWVDPTKEVAAYKEAVLAGFITVSDVISQTGNGRDLEDVLQERRRELDMMEALDLEFDTEYTDPADMVQPAAAAPKPAVDDDADPAAPPARLFKVS
jgi:lambda family phage portal protein